MREDHVFGDWKKKKKVGSDGQSSVLYKRLRQLSRFQDGGRFSGNWAFES